jgi:hypothetical protein
MSKRRRPKDSEEESSKSSDAPSSPATSTSEVAPLTRAEKKAAKKKAERAKKKAKKRQSSPAATQSAVPSATVATGGPSQPASVSDALAGPGRVKTAAHDIWYFFTKGSTKDKTRTICKLCEWVIISYCIVFVC